MGPAQADVFPARTSRKVHNTGNGSPRSRFPAIRAALFCSLAIILLVIYKRPPFPTYLFSRFWLGKPTSGLVGSLPPHVNSTTCPQWPALRLTKHLELSEDLDTAYNSEHFKRTAIQALGDAIRVP
jgi:hypothetical protein